MKRVSPRILLGAAGAVMVASAQTYSMANYKPQPGLQAQISDKILTLTWDERITMNCGCALAWTGVCRWCARLRYGKKAACGTRWRRT